jgi:hypothetical protein
MGGSMTIRTSDDQENDTFFLIFHLNVGIFFIYLSFIYCISLCHIFFFSV